MFEKLIAKLKRNRRQLTDREIAEEEAIRREAEQERLRAEAKRAEQRAPLDGYGGGW